LPGDSGNRGRADLRGEGGQGKGLTLLAARDPSLWSRRLLSSFVAAVTALLFALATSSGFAQSAPTPVAAYSFNEGTGTTVADASGTGNAGTIGSATWTSQGKYANGLVFNGTSARVTVPDAASLDLTSAMTLEAWVYPTTTLSSWKDLIYKGNDNYYLMASSCCQSRPAVGGIFGGSYAHAYGTSTLAANTWTHVAATYDGSMLRLYVNGVQVGSQAKTGALTPSTSPLSIGGDSLYGQYFTGRIDEVRVYNAALSASQIQTDMATAIGGGGGDTTPPTVSISSPANGASVSDIINVTANASDNVGVVGVQFYVDGVATGGEDTTAPYALAWDTRNSSNGSHTLTARARDAAGNSTLSAAVSVNVANSGSSATFQNEILATGFDLPTSIEFLPDGRMLVVELRGIIKVMSPPYTDPSPTPFLQITNIGSAGVQQGIFDIALDPNFPTNRFYYVFYTLGTPNHDRLSRFTANATLTGTVAGSEFVLYEDPLNASAEHHGGAINFGNDGKLYFTTGEHFSAVYSQQLSSPRGKIHRINPDGTVPTDNPFYDGAGPNVDSIWARGLRNPFRAYYDAPTGRFYIGDVGGNDAATAWEEIDLGAAGANYGWPDCEFGTCGNSAFTAGIYAYPHAGRDASVTGGFVYHGSQFPSEYKGSYFFADYTQNWIKRLTFDANGNVSGVFNFEPPDGSVDGPYGDIVYLTEGPDGALYYVDLGYSDVSFSYGVSKIRRIRYTGGANQPPTAVSNGTPLSGLPPLTVNFSSAGSSDPEGQTLGYSWDFGDGTSSTAANPAHTYLLPGQYTVRLTVSDGTNSTLAAPLTVTVGTPPTPAILAPLDGSFFNAGDVISFSGTAVDLEDGVLPASAFTWNIDFLHDGHVHPGSQFANTTSGSFTIPTSGHDFSGNTRYKITLTVRDSVGLISSTSVTVWPRKVNLSFNTVPSGLTLQLDGIAKLTPFVYDTLVGFNHTIGAQSQTFGGTSYTFSSWSDGGAASHGIVVPATNQSYVATFQSSGAPAPVAAYSFNEGTGTTVADASGTGNAGTIGSATWTTQGKYGNALVFGSNQRVTVPDSASLHLTGAMTLEAWVYPTTTPSGWRDIVYKGNDNYYLMASSSPLARPAVGGTFGGSATDLRGTSAIPANAWTHLAGTYNGSTIRLYVNGVQVASKAKTGALATSTNALSIGGDSIYGQYFTGRIDEVRVYNSALSASQIQTDMASAIGGGGGDTTPPTAPTGLTATAAGSSQINLSWTAATDNVGVTGYRVERCQGAGCSNFAEIGTTSPTSFGDTGLSASTSYSYRVRATDAATNLGPYSNTATATTLAGGGPSPVAAYSFNEGTGTTVADVSGTGNAGTIGTAAWTTQGKYGGALAFDGSSASVIVPDSASLDLTTGMTLEAWVNPSTALTGWKDVIYKGDDNYYLMGCSSSLAPAGGGKFAGVYGEVFGTGALAPNTWTHLAATYDGATLKLYVNGVLVASTVQTGALTPSTNPLSIGGDPIYGQYFAGLIDEVRVYNTALTQAQVQTDMNIALP
jgi:glucose/arabinose dehydrogenase/chitodextrinase